MTYNNGKHPFDDKFIDTFNYPGLKAFLKWQRITHGCDDPDSEYSTVENWLYNRTIEEIGDDCYNFLVGYMANDVNHTSDVTTSINAAVLSEFHLCSECLQPIKDEMDKDNNWEEHAVESDDCLHRYPKNDENLTKEEMSNLPWCKFKIFVASEADKEQLQGALLHLHNCNIDTNIIAVNQIVHCYLDDSGLVEIKPEIFE